MTGESTRRLGSSSNSNSWVSGWCVGSVSDQGLNLSPLRETTPGPQSKIVARKKGEDRWKGEKPDDGLGCSDTSTDSEGIRSSQGSQEQEGLAQDQRGLP